MFVYDTKAAFESGYAPNENLIIFNLDCEHSNIKIDLNKLNEIPINKFVDFLSKSETRNSFIHEFRHVYQHLVLGIPMISRDPFKSLDVYYNFNIEYDSYTTAALQKYLKDFTDYSQSESGKSDRNLTIKNILKNLSNEKFYKHFDWRHRKMLKKRVFKYFYDLGIIP